MGSLDGSLGSPRDESSGMFKNDNKPSSVEDLSSLAVSSLKERKSRSRTDSLSSDKDSDKSSSVCSKKKKKTDSTDDMSSLNADLSGFDMSFPKCFEPEFATSIFELGLKHSSPKVLMSLMPLYTNLHSEHLKSHLQKYRIHHERSKDEFLAFYNEYMKDIFQQWEDSKGWEKKRFDNNENIVEKPSNVPLIDITTAANSIQNTDKISVPRSSSSSSSSAGMNHAYVLFFLVMNIFF